MTQNHRLKPVQTCPNRFKPCPTQLVQTLSNLTGSNLDLTGSNLDLTDSNLVLNSDHAQTGSNLFKHESGIRKRFRVLSTSDDEYSVC